MESVKQVLHVYQSASTHWVGDGFHVRNLFPSNDLGQRISPFLLLDYAGPTHFSPTDRPHGVGEHPHRGFETVTIIYQGEVEHRDSAGNHGIIGPGDVQWMTAASGVVHEEMHEKEFAKRGGTVEMVQLWVNLPRAFKMSPPRYQTLLKEQIPVVDLPKDSGYVRVIAGDFHDIKGPAKTFTPINLYDLKLKAGHQAELTLPAGYNTGIFLLKGKIVLNNSHSLAGSTTTTPSWPPSGAIPRTTSAGSSRSPTGRAAPGAPRDWRRSRCTSCSPRSSGPTRCRVAWRSRTASTAWG